MKPGSTTNSRKPSEHGMTSYILTKTEKIPHTTICGEGYADSLLGWTRGKLGALHAKGETLCPVQRMHISQRITCVLQISPNDVDVSVQEFRSNMTILGPILPAQLLTTIQDKSFQCLPYFRTHQTSPPQWLSCLWADQRCDGMQVFQVRRWVAADGARLAALSAKNNFFLEVSMYFRSAGTLVWKAMKTTRENEFIVYLLCSTNYEIIHI